MLRRGWKTDPAIAFTKQQDVVHRVVGPPGIVLVGEGNPNRLRQLLTSERRKHERVAAEPRSTRSSCGNGEGEVPLPKLVRHVQKLGAQVKPAEMTDILHRLKALDANRAEHPDAQGPGADQHEGHARQPARPLSRGRPAGLSLPPASSATSSAGGASIVDVGSPQSVTCQVVDADLVAQVGPRSGASRPSLVEPDVVGRRVSGRSRGSPRRAGRRSVAGVSRDQHE